MSKKIIEVKHLGKRYIEAKNSREGEFHIFLGASGCGKSTLMNILAGFLDMTEGEALLYGKPIKGPGQERGVIFQNADAAIFLWMTVYKNVEYGLKMQHVDKKTRKETSIRAVRRYEAACTDCPQYSKQSGYSDYG